MSILIVIRKLLCGNQTIRVLNMTFYSVKTLVYKSRHVFFFFNWSLDYLFNTAVAFTMKFIAEGEGVFERFYDKL